MTWSVYAHPDHICLLAPFGDGAGRDSKVPRGRSHPVPPGVSGSVPSKPRHIWVLCVWHSLIVYALGVSKVLGYYGVFD